MQPLWLLFLLGSIFSSSVFCEEEKKEPLKLSTGEEVKILQVDNKLTLKCTFYHEDDKQLTINWIRNESPLFADDHFEMTSWESKVDMDEAHNNFTQTTVSKLVIKKALDDDIGYYKCIDASKEHSKSFLVSSISYTNLAKSTEVNEADTVGLSCHAEGDAYLKPVVAWLKEDEPLLDAVNASKLTVFSNSEGLEGAAFNISDTDQTDRGHYTCVITYEEALVFQTTTNLRVKDPLRALWPFLGIVLQAILLAVTIFVCEKMRNKEGDDDSDDDGSVAKPSTSAVAT